MVSCSQEFSLLLPWTFSSQSSWNAICFSHVVIINNTPEDQFFPTYVLPSDYFLFLPTFLPSHDFERRNILYVHKSICLLFRYLKLLEIYLEFIFAETCIPMWVHRKQMHWVAEKRRDIGFCQAPFHCHLMTYIFLGMESSCHPSLCVCVCACVRAHVKHVTHFRSRF